MSLCLKRLVLSNPAAFLRVGTNGSSIISRSEHSVKISKHIINEVKKQSCADTPIFDMKNPFEREKATCILCKYNIEPDYKNVRLLSQFQSSYTGRIYGRHITRLCTHKQHRVEIEMIKAQNAGLMGGYTKVREYLNDPKIFDPENPIRSHKY